MNFTYDKVGVPYGIPVPTPAHGAARNGSRPWGPLWQPGMGRGGGSQLPITSLFGIDYSLSLCVRVVWSPSKLSIDYEAEL